LSDAFPVVRRGLPVRYSGSAQIEANAAASGHVAATPPNSAMN